MVLVVENGEVIALLDIAKCLYDVVARLERAAEKGKAIVDVVEGVEKNWGASVLGTLTQVSLTSTINIEQVLFHVTDMPILPKFKSRIHPENKNIYRNVLNWQKHLLLKSKQMYKVVGALLYGAALIKIEELEFKKKQQETKAIETSRKAIPSMEKCKKQLMIANSDFVAKMKEKFLNLVSKLEEKDTAITRFTRVIR
ncbi:hypothetical protein KY290_001009 [Solanum tuberosum]|uniref:Uncharacterized protein n=1 Tax=Solanum tuberosum TaxID=4113 RepID=A0ABQ7WMA7_SOLTU|nr:hypothetical protein KY290_001009 [Solanum tuberosum]